MPEKRTRAHNRSLSLVRPTMKAPDKIGETGAAVDRTSWRLRDQLDHRDRILHGSQMDDPEFRQSIRALMSFTGEPWRESQIGDIHLPSKRKRQ